MQLAEVYGKKAPPFPGGRGTCPMCASAVTPGRAVGICHGPLNLVERAEQLQHLLADLAAMVAPELMELAPRVRHAADLGHAHFEASLVAGEVVADELALPGWLAWRSGQAEEVAGVLATTAVGEVPAAG